jgi:endonuclease YncB( thermonuclease family)
MLTLLLGCSIGLSYAQWQTLPVPQSSDPFGGALPPTPDRWAESRRSRNILEAQEAPAGPSPFERRTRVSAGAIRVVDGDTFHMGGEKIRILDIDTPETHPARCAAEQALGDRATVRLRQLLAAGPFELVALGDRDEDRYGRKLRLVMRGGQSLGDVLVAEGLARPYAGGRRPWCGTI